MKKAIIVGASSGIGRSLAKLMVENGYQVGITGRRANLLNELKAENPDSYVTQSFDITDIATISAQLQALTHTLGSLDILILSSGTGDLNESLDFDIEQRTINTNVSGFTAVADWAFNFFREQGHGHLVAISSIAGLRGNYLAPSYSATKAYQINYLEGLRIKAAKSSQSLIITDIRPGFVNTEMAKGENLFWVAPVDKAASQILKAIQQKRKTAYITKRWGILARIMILLPNWVIDRM